MGLNLDKIQAQREAFEKHPIGKLGLQEKIYYLRALGLVLHIEGARSSRPDDSKEENGQENDKRGQENPARTGIKDIIEGVLAGIDEFDIEKIKNDILDINKYIDEIENAGARSSRPNDANGKKGQENEGKKGQENPARTGEREYFKLLIDSFGIKDDFIIEFFDEFEFPDEEEVVEIFEMIKVFKLEKVLLLEVLIVSYIGEEGHVGIGFSYPNARTFFYDLCDVFKIKDGDVEEIELLAKYIDFKSKKAYEVLRKDGFSLKFGDFEYLLKFYNIKEDKFNEGDYRIYFDEYFGELKDDILFFGEYDYESGLKGLNEIKSLFFEDYDYENELNKFINTIK